jgi:hypothetical protein
MSSGVLFGTAEGFCEFPLSPSYEAKSGSKWPFATRRKGWLHDQLLTTCYLLTWGWIGNSQNPLVVPNKTPLGITSQNFKPIG